LFQNQVLLDITFIVFFFALGASIGSFLNVVVWRLPRNESLISPPSHCPKCNHKLAWYDNIPIFGWIALRGKCRYCGTGISARYPIIEAFTALLFVFYYVMFFLVQKGPCPPAPAREIDVFGRMTIIPTAMNILSDWPIYLLYMFLIGCLLAASLIDAESYMIPIEIPWLAAAVGVVVHTVIDHPTLPGALNAAPLPSAIAMGALAGLIVSIVLLRLGVIPQSFANEQPALEIDKQRAPDDQSVRDFSPAELRAEMRKEMLFLIPPLLGSILWTLLCWKVPPFARMWSVAAGYHWVSGGLGAVLGALVGAFVVWFTRIFFTFIFRREAMGMGDVHLMLGIGAVMGAGAATTAFFIAPFFGIALALYMFFARKKRELPYGPYLSLAAAFLMITYCPIADHLAPGFQGLGIMLRQVIFG
jgi:leader peptidase (prepilin peptidase) / N-methyltransferase